VLTWAQLGLHAKPCGLLNVAGFYQPYIDLLDHALEERFLAAEHRAMLLVGDDPAALLDRFAAYRPPRVEKWIDRERS
jgi:predicted Rossmann-fold nucleotide-binding protein